MTKIVLCKQHSKSNEEVEAIVDKLESDLKSKFQLSTRRNGDKILFTRSGVDGELTIGDQQIDINMKLGMMMAMMASTIENEIKSKLNKYLD